MPRHKAIPPQSLEPSLEQKSLAIMLKIGERDRWVIAGIESIAERYNAYLGDRYQYISKFDLQNEKNNLLKFINSEEIKNIFNSWREFAVVQNNSGNPLPKGKIDIRIRKDGQGLPESFEIKYLSDVGNSANFKVDLIENAKNIKKAKLDSSLLSYTSIFSVHSNYNLKTTSVANSQISFWNRNIICNGAVVLAAGAVALATAYSLSN